MTDPTPPDGSAPALRAISVGLRFGAVAALVDISFEVPHGELFAIIGPNGAGKTSLFNLLSRVYDPTSGRLLLNGRDMARLRPHHLARSGVARTFQNLGLFKAMSVIDNVLVGRQHLMRSGSVRAGLFVPSSRREEKANRAAAAEALDFVGLAGHELQPVGALPYGIQKRVEMARALAMEPKLLLLDEPVAGMSQDERDEIRDLIGRVHRDRDLTIVLVEHDMGVVMSLAQRVLALDFGRMVAIGTPAEIQRNEEVIRSYLGEAHEAIA